MYNAIPANAKTEEQAEEIVGSENMEKIMKENCDFSGRVIDDCYECAEMTASINCTDVDGNDCILTVHYLISNDDTEEYEDAGNYDYSEYYFTIN